jgi:hypothetical protein
MKELKIIEGWEHEMQAYRKEEYFQEMIVQEVANLLKQQSEFTLNQIMIKIIQIPKLEMTVSDIKKALNI